MPFDCVSLVSSYARVVSGHLRLISYEFQQVSKKDRRLEVTFNVGLLERNDLTRKDVLDPESPLRGAKTY